MGNLKGIEFVLQDWVLIQTGCLIKAPKLQNYQINHQNSKKAQPFSTAISVASSVQVYIIYIYIYIYIYDIHLELRFFDSIWKVGLSGI